MIPVLTDTRASTLQHFFWRHPEWWSAGLCWLAWAVMLSRGWLHAGHRMPYPYELVHWLLMVAAMMLPFSMDAIRVTAESSLWERRHRAIAGFILGYFAPWLALGILAAGLREASWTHTYAAAALGFAGAALWLRTPIHIRAMIACHSRRPLAPLGWQADGDCVRFGATIGIACVRSCWPLMLACAFAGHGLIAMTGGMAVGVAERWSFRPRRRAALLITLALASYYVVLAVWEQGVAATR